MSHNPLWIILQPIVSYFHNQINTNSLWLASVDILITCLLPLVSVSLLWGEVTCSSSLQEILGINYPCWICYYRQASCRGVSWKVSQDTPYHSLGYGWDCNHWQWHAGKSSVCYHVRWSLHTSLCLSDPQAFPWHEVARHIVAPWNGMVVCLK